MKISCFLKNLIAVVLALFFFSRLTGCSNGKRTDTKRRQAIVADVSDRYDGKDVHFERQSVNSLEVIEEPLQISYEKVTPRPIETKSDSEVTVLYDSFGNKIETRAFNDDPLINVIMIRTPVSGNKSVFVFAQNGEVKNLPEDMAERVLSIPGSEIARNAGIFEGKKVEQENLPFAPEINIPASPLTVLLDAPSAPTPVVSEKQEMPKQEEPTSLVKQEKPPNNQVKQPSADELIRQLNLSNMVKKNKSDIAKENKKDKKDPE